MSLAQNLEKTEDKSMFLLSDPYGSPGGGGLGSPGDSQGCPLEVQKALEGAPKGPLGDEGPPLGQPSIYTNSRSTAFLRPYSYMKVRYQNGMWLGVQHEQA